MASTRRWLNRNSLVSRGLTVLNDVTYAVLYNARGHSLPPIFKLEVKISELVKANVVVSPSLMTSSEDEALIIASQSYEYTAGAGFKETAGDEDIGEVADRFLLQASQNFEAETNVPSARW